MLRIEKECDGCTTTLRLTGRIQSGQIEGIQSQIDNNTRAILELGEVTLVDVEVVRFLGDREESGTQLHHCPPYIREWISRERAEGMPSP